MCLLRYDVVRMHMQTLTLHWYDARMMYDENRPSDDPGIGMGRVQAAEGHGQECLSGRSRLPSVSPLLTTTACTTL